MGLAPSRVTQNPDENGNREVPVPLFQTRG